MLTSEEQADANEARQRAVLEQQKAVLESQGEEPVQPMAQATLEEHQEKQRAYREWMAKMEAQSAAQAATEATEEAAPEPEPEDPAVVEARALAQWQAEYDAAVQADKDAGVALYVVGTRPPRPRWNDRQLELGQIVPGAHAFARIDTWVSSGILVPAAMARL